MPDETPPPATPPPPPPSTPPPSGSQLTPQEKDARTWNMLCHLSSLCGLLGIPFGNVLGPLVVWLVKKNEIPSVDVHGKESLNFQITVAIVAYGLGIIGVLTLAICIGIVFIIAAILVGVGALVLAIIAGIKANDGKEFKYPYSFKLIS